MYKITFEALRQVIREEIEWNRPHRVDYEQGRITPGQRFYHASPRRFRHGDILTGGHSGGWGSAHSNVCMTTSPDPHVTIRASIPGWSNSHTQEYIDAYGDDESRPGRLQSQASTDWYVYEVEPMHSVRYVKGNNEYQTRAARVIRNLGKASALLKKRHPDGGTAIALSPARDRDRLTKYADRRSRRAKKNDEDKDE